MTVPGSDDFEVLQALHVAAVECLTDDRLHELTPGMRALTVLFAVCGDIDNSGFSACMYNSTGDWIGEAIDAARLIRADEHAHVFERFAAVAMDGDLSMSRQARARRVAVMNESDPEVLDRLDRDFYALADIEGVLSRHVENHPSEFFRD